MKKRKIKSLHISARRWFDKVNGNTYHSVSVFVNGAQGETLKAPYQYGYGDQWIQTAQALLESAGYDLKFSQESGQTVYGNNLGTYHLREALNGTYSVADVGRKKDL